MLKKIFTIALFGAVCFSAAAQTVNIPDAHFKGVLLKYAPKIDLNDNKEIEADEAAKVTNLNLVNDTIADLTGIEAFTALTFLDCSRNQLTDISLVSHTALQKLVCKQNKLTQLDITNNTKLTVLHCSFNQIASLDVTKNIALKDIDCHSNAIPSIDLTKLVNLTIFWGSYNKLTTLDVSKNTLLDLLAVGYNNLGSIDISKNTVLTHIEFPGCNLSTIDLSANTKLRYAWIAHNNFTSLDLKYCPVLNTLHINHNKLSSVDLTYNTAIGYLYCNNNSNLTELDLRSLTNITKLECHFNPLLKVICLAKTYDTTTWKKDDAATYSTTCNATAVADEVLLAPKKIYKVYSIEGIEVDVNHKGLGVYVYTDGSTDKIFKAE